VNIFTAAALLSWKFLALLQTSNRVIYGVSCDYWGIV
jgi:hypothetical protein